MSFHHRPNRIFTVAIGLAAVICVALPVAAQEGWTGSIGAAYLWQSSDGNEDAFRTQLGLQEGFLLDEFTLNYGSDGGLQKFSLGVWGFGDADPSRKAVLGFDFAGGFGLTIDYTGNDSFFNLAGGDLSLRTYDWSITRWKGTLSFDGWKPVAAALTYRRYERDGHIDRPFYGLNELYPATIELDESMDEVTLWLATRTLPVKLEFEQSLANYTRKNRPSPNGTEAIGGDPDLLDELHSNYDSEIEVPTSRFTASYGSRVFEGVATILYADSDLDAEGASVSSFAIGGGPTGTMTFMDELVGSAQMENLAAAVNLGIRIANRFTIRLDGNYREATTDGSLLGTRMFHSHSPLGGSLDLSAPVDESGRYETTDGLVRVTAEYRAPSWGLWAGGLTASREVAWSQTAWQEAYDVTRDSDGWFVGGSLNLGSSVDATLEYSRGDFQRYVFRTDPQDVDRVSFKLRSHLGKGWRLNLHGMHEAASNPSSWANLDWETSPYGVGVDWSSQEGYSSAGLTLDRMELSTETGLILPSGDPGISRYDTEVTIANLYGRIDRERWRLYGSGTYLMDDGSTWPLESWNVQFRASLIARGGFEYGVIGEYWSYNEDWNDVDDYDVTRYGVFLRWRFE